MESLLSENPTMLSNKVSSNVIPVVCGADDKYAMPLAVTVCSILANLAPSRKILLFIVDGGIKELNKQRIIKSINSDRCTIEWLKPSEDLLGNLKLTGHFSIAIYYRLLIPELLPQFFDRAIYLDCDLIVNTDLGSFGILILRIIIFLPQ
jgi:lipopolysaccharide biosynthesis glycosyltransferase